ncbi:MAG TPA: hypothetical protein VFQ61_00465, partial [Polyangiaceae bacterium]|nr:hypothetical protein [Polyangiaceae bacterium]
ESYHLPDEVLLSSPVRLPDLAGSRSFDALEPARHERERPNSRPEPDRQWKLARVISSEAKERCLPLL